MKKSNLKYLLASFTCTVCVYVVLKQSLRQSYVPMDSISVGSLVIMNKVADTTSQIHLRKRTIHQSQSDAKLNRTKISKLDTNGIGPDSVASRPTDVNQPVENMTSREGSRNNTGSDAGLPKILCWVMCDPDDLEKRVRHVKVTWARHCDVTLYMSSVTNTSFPTIGLDVPSGREHIGLKSRLAWTYVYNHHLHEAHYFLKADPDTFLIVPNLKLYLADRNPDDAEFFGHNLWLNTSKALKYNSGGPGQVLSREALRRMVSKAFTMPGKHCMTDGQGEDYKTAQCLELVNASIVDTRDPQGRETFMVFPPRIYYSPNYIPDWYIERDVNGCLMGKACCSVFPISFHYVDPNVMHALYYIFYEIKQFNQANATFKFIEKKGR